MLDKISSGKIFDYFAYEIFQKLERNTQELLLKTSFLPEMTARMAGQLADTRSAEEILDRLSRDRCFMDSCFQEKPVYHYHPLFGDFLRSVARDFFGEEDLSRIKKSAAEILEESGRIEDAVRLLRDCGDVDGLTRVIQNWAQSLVKQGRYQTLHDWLNSLPVDILLGNPWLRYWTGISRLPFSPDESMSQFETAFHQFRIRKEAEGVFLSWCGIVESIMYGSEGLEPLDRWLFSIEELMKEFNGFPSDDMEANVACSLIRCLALRRPVGFDMKKWADRIQVIIRKSTDIPLKVRALINLSSYFYSEGNFQKLEIVLESLKELLKNRDIPPLSRLTIDWVKAAYFNVMSRYDECRIVLTNGLELAHTLKMSLMEHLLLGHGVLSSLKSDDHETAKKDLQKMAAALSFLKPWEVCFYHYCAAWEALYRNDLAHASTHSEQCMKCEALGNPWPLTLAHLLNAYIAFAFGEIKKSKDHIIKARSIGIRSKNEFTSFVCLMTEAYFYIKQGKELAAIDAMREGLRIGREKGFVNLFMSQKDVLRTVFSKALDAGIESDYVISLIKRNNIVPDSACLEIEQWPWPLKIFTLGRFGLIKNGKPVQISGKVQHKPLEMLKALIAAGGREVAGDHLEDVLWPEAEGDAAHSAFATTLSRLRQLIGIEQAIKFQEGKASLDQRYCWVDVWPFERLIGKVDAAWNEIRTRSNGVPPIVRLAEKAVKMHTGPFLAGDNEPWAISTRERLRNKLLRNVMRLGLYWEEAGNREKAIECYQKGLEVDDLMEEFYRRIIKCYLQMGRRAEALAICTRCRTILSSVLGVEPSPETMALVRDLKR
jgi:DNA-binding SARP family transcriptional activator